MCRLKNSILNKRSGGCALETAGNRSLQHRLRLQMLMPILTLFLLASSCSLSLFPGYHKQQNASVTGLDSWFRTDTGHFLFNTTIDIFKKHFSGIMVVKPVEGSYRVVFITEVGLKIFDMEFRSDSLMKVHYIMEAMNKKALVNTLSNDIGLVLMNDLPSAGKPEILRHRHAPDIIYRYRHDGMKNYYYLNSADPRPYFVKQTGCVTNKVRADIFGNKDTGIDSVKIRHYNLRLSINLYRINE
jgi:hypothetical protein